MQTTKHPYEFLVRWDGTGRLAGAHAQFRFVTTDEHGTPLGEFLGPVQPVAAAGQAGFPMEDILSPMLADALAERDALLGERDALAARLNALAAGSPDSPAP